MARAGQDRVVIVAVIAAVIGANGIGADETRAAAAAAGEQVAELEPLVNQARRAGLRVLEGRRLVLVTDRPARAGDGVAELPAVFDQAFTSWCDHYGMSADDAGACGACGESGNGSCGKGCGKGCRKGCRKGC